MGPPAIRVGAVVIPGRVALAPLAGYTDYPFRAAVAFFGCPYAVTPLISAEGLTRRNAATEALLTTGPGDAAAVAAQIFGARPAAMAEAASRLADLGFLLVDINLGCPAPKVRRQRAGADLLDDPVAIRRIARAVVASCPVPVTAKLRLGYAAPTKAGLAAAKLLVEEGVAALTVHGRTVAQGFSGAVDYDAIGEIAAAVAVPVWANGGVRSGEGARMMVERTGAAGVMVGRGALGRPYLIDHIERYLAGGETPSPPSRRELGGVIMGQFDRAAALAGERRAAQQFRKHLAAYLRELAAPKALWLRAVGVCGRADVQAVVSDLLEESDGP